jgi:hypothetical protein
LTYITKNNKILIQGVDIMESKQSKFKRLAESRTNKLLHYIDLLGNLSNKKIYEYSDKEVNKIFSTLDKELKRTKAKFKNQSSEKKKFKL